MNLAPLTLSILGSLAAAGCQMGEPQIETETQAIVNGAKSADESVVALTIGGRQFCTGTLITPRVVLTAAHCLSIEVFFGSQVGGFAGTFIPVVDGLAHPEWTEDELPNDIGLLALASDAPALPARLPTQAFDQVAEGGMAVRVVGYGFDSAETDGNTSNGIKREGTAMVDGFDADSVYLSPGPSATCSGDSGGPLFIQENGVDVIAGINSRSDCVDVAINQRVDIHVYEFIEPFISENHVGECYGPSCGEAMCSGDGMCNEDCAVDPDCGGFCFGDKCETEPATGCSVGTGERSNPSALWLLLAAFALIRRRR
jgi:MYXO-CTERM domain-containing protein